MSLPTRELDDRSFQQIVDEIKPHIGLRCPEWTDHNVSDPGVTLIELFAMMTEMMLFRMNQVPERNYVKFLDLLGISLEPPVAAQTNLRFRLASAIEDVEGAPEVLLKAGQTVAGTVRTETDDAVEFTTDRDLRMVRPCLRYIVSLTRSDARSGTLDGLSKERDFTRHEPGAGDTGDSRRRPNGWRIFSAIPNEREEDALYLGFESAVPGNLVELSAYCLEAAATGRNPRYPSQIWEWKNVREDRWMPLTSPSDSTCGFTVPGKVELEFPHDMQPWMLLGQPAHWVRCRYTTARKDLPPRNDESPYLYQASPEITNLRARVIGGVAPASNCMAVMYEEIGQSDGSPGQIFRLRHAPILPPRLGDCLLAGSQDTPTDMMEKWQEVPDFSTSDEEDRHYTVDRRTGEVHFGPNIVQPNGESRQYGAVPSKGMTLIFSAYRFGGGLHGNVGENRIAVLKSSIPHISEVTNPMRASDGCDQEELDRAKMRARERLRVHERAVTREDFEVHARRVPGVGRAHCIQPTPVHDVGASGANVPPGVVRMLIVPTINDSVDAPRPRDLEVSRDLRDEVLAELDGRRLLTTVLEVAEPDYLYVSTDIRLVADERYDADRVADRVRQALCRHIRPIGGRGAGWPFGQPLTLSDIYAQVGSVDGVAFLLDAKIWVSRVVNVEEGLFSREDPVEIERGIPLLESQMLCTREHRIVVRPMRDVGRHAELAGT